MAFLLPTLAGLGVSVATSVGGELIGKALNKARLPGTAHVLTSATQSAASGVIGATAGNLAQLMTAQRR